MQESIPIRGLHHVTATVGDAQDDLDFYTGGLNLRLIKKTVNFDNHNVYHFYYGNERGAPGTLMTTFPYKGWGVRQGVIGVGQITATAFSVPEESIGYWQARLEELGLGSRGIQERFGEASISVSDPSGLDVELIAGGGDDRPQWTGRSVEENAAVRGLHGITIAVRRPDPTIAFLADVLGWTVLNQTGDRTRMGVGEGRPGSLIDVLHDPDGPEAVNGLGTVHHVAMAVDDEEAQLAARETLLEAGVHVTEVRDRQYFKSIYFREPGGVLYEIATRGPGFLVDEELDELGCELKLPPWEEGFRKDIEEQLPAVRH